MSPPLDPPMAFVEVVTHDGLERRIAEIQDSINVGLDTKAQTAQALTAAQAALQQANTANGTVAWWGGDHTTLPPSFGLYRIVGSSAPALAEAGQVWERTAFGLARRPELEAVSTTYVDATRGQSIAPAFFGLHIDTRSLSQYRPELGYGALRVWDSGCHWRQIETSKNVYDWSRLDAVMTQAAALGLDVLYVHGQAPDFATATPGSGSYNPNPVSNLQDARDFAAALARRNLAVYGGRITTYEAWNEPNLASFWTGTAAQQVAYTQAIREAIRAVQPGALIASPSPTGDQGGQGPAYLAQLLAAGLAPFIDVVAVHLYNMPGQPEGQLGTMRDYRAVMAQYGVGGLPVWDTEVTWSKYARLSDGATVTFSAADTSTLMSDEQAVSYLMRLYLVAAAAGVSRTYFYDPASQGFGGLPLITADQTGLTAAGAAYQQLRAQLVGARVADAAQGSDGRYAVTFDAPNGARFSYAWTADNKPRLQRNDPAGPQISRARVGTAAEASVTGSLGVSHTPTLLRQASPGVGSRTAQTLAGARPTRILNRNHDLRQRGGPSEPVIGWVSGPAVSTYAVTPPAPVGGRAITLTAASRYSGFGQQVLEQLIPGERYAIELDYLLPVSDVQEWFVNLETGLGSSAIASVSGYLPATGTWGTYVKEFEVPLGYVPPAEMLLRVTEVHAISRNPLSVNGFRLIQLSEAQPQLRGVRRYDLASYPASGTYLVGDQVWFTTPALQAQYGPALVCTAAGTYGVLAGVTGSIAAGTNTLTVNTASGLSVGMVFVLAGSTLRYAVVSITGTAVKLDRNADATLTDAAVGLPGPTWTQLIGAAGNVFTVPQVFNVLGDGATLLEFRTERPWKLKQGLTGAVSTLDLQTTTDEKILRLTNAANVSRMDFYNGNNAFIRTYASGTATGDKSGYLIQHDGGGNSQKVGGFWIEKTATATRMVLRHDRQGSTRDVLSYDMATEALTVDATTLTVTPPTTFTGNVSLSGTAGSNRDLNRQTAGVSRWTERLDTTDNLNLIRRDAAGAFVGTTWNFNVSNGNAYFQDGSFTVNGTFSKPFLHSSNAYWTSAAGVARFNAGGGSGSDNGGLPLSYKKLTGTTSATIGTGTAIAHGLGYAPTQVLLTARGAGAVYYTAADATNITVASTAASIPFDLYVG